MNRLVTRSPGEELLAHVKAGFVSQGTTLTRWCMESGLKRQNVRLCLLGGWNGPKARALRERVVSASSSVRAFEPRGASSGRSTVECNLREAA